MNRYDKISDDLKMDISNWPHRFTKNGRVYQVGEENHDPIFAQPMICVDCHAEYIAGVNNRPPDPCPARNKNREMKRLLS